MATFKVKNLMIDVAAVGERIPNETLCSLRTRFCMLTDHCLRIISKCYWFKSIIPCRLWTYHGCPLGTEIPCPHESVIPCIGGSHECYGSDIPIEETIACGGGSGEVVVDLEQLVVNPAAIEKVRVELDNVLKAASARAGEIDQAMLPHTKAQATDLAKQLTEALKVVEDLAKKLPG